MTGVASEFADAIAACGLTPPDSVIADGRLHRFSSTGKPGCDSGWYVLFGDGVPAGRFGDWRTGISESWRARSERRPSDEERGRIARQRAERELARQREREQAAIKARLIWSESNSVSAHPYLTKKRVMAHGIRVFGETLVVPMRDGCDLWSLQFIDADGGKKFLRGGRSHGLYHAIQGARRDGDDVLCVAEGYATAATINERTGHAVAVAFNAGNLLPVAAALRARMPERRIVICADDDYRTPGNPGLTYAKEAAAAVGGRVMLPDFGGERPNGATDFNDLAASGAWGYKWAA
jgi:putative DNA primase/helicase